MNAQEAAYKILMEVGKPLRPKEIANIALDRGYLSSDSRDPVGSIATTITKNIREGKYNSPQLIFVPSEDGRKGQKIGLPSMSKVRDIGDLPTSQLAKEKLRLTIELSQELMEQIQLAHQAKLANSYDETVAFLIKRGLSSSAPEIRERVLSQLESI